MWTGLLRVELQGASSPPPRTVPHTAAPGAATVPGCCCFCCFFSPRSPLVWLPRWVSPFWHLFLSSGVAPSSVDLFLVCGSGWAPEATQGRLSKARRHHSLCALPPVSWLPCPVSASHGVGAVHGLASWATGELLSQPQWRWGTRSGPSPPHLPTLRNGELSH